MEILAGDESGAERELRVALQMALTFSERDMVAKITSRLSRSLSTRGATQEAERFATMSFDYAPAESIAARTLWRAAKARAMANRDDDREAEHLAREALRVAPVEMPNLQADLLTNLAEILLARADRGTAMPLITAAIQFYERKGNIVSATRARSLVS